MYKSTKSDCGGCVCGGDAVYGKGEESIDKEEEVHESEPVREGGAGVL